MHEHPVAHSVTDGHFVHLTTLPSPEVICLLQASGRRLTKWPAFTTSHGRYCRIVHSYQQHPNCKTFIAFVYDPDKLIKNPAALERDLSKPHNGMPVHVFIAQG